MKNIDYLKDNCCEKLEEYRIDYLEDAVLDLLCIDEDIKFAYINKEKTKKVFLSNKRIITEDKGETLNYSFVSYDVIYCIYLNANSIDRQASGVDITFGLKTGGNLQLVFKEEIDVIALQKYLSSRVF